MLDHAITFKDLVEGRQRTTAIDQVIFRDDLEPVHYGFLLEDVGVMRNPQTDADPVIREPVKSIAWHRFKPRGRRTLATAPGEGLLLGWRLGAVGGAATLSLA